MSHGVQIAVCLWLMISGSGCWVKAKLKGEDATFQSLEVWGVAIWLAFVLDAVVK